ncbi:hypothetical protein GQ54DRAFT_298447 [Martensiomyces pterosporus]|nr:hypothetical protein GQ54DRAFT_298447 [Martensiomyces pterosporus]
MCASYKCADTGHRLLDTLHHALLLVPHIVHTAPQQTATMSDVRTSKPYFRFKRGPLTVFVETPATEKISKVKACLLEALHQHGDDFKSVVAGDIRLAVPQESAADAQHRALDENATVRESELADDQAILFVLRNSDGKQQMPLFEPHSSTRAR